MADFKLGRAFFETSLDLAGLRRDLNKAEQTVKRFSGKIERQVKGGKAFDFVRPFKTATADLGKEANKAAQQMGNLSNSTNILKSNVGKLVAKYLAAGAALYTIRAAFKATVNAAKEFEVSIANIDTLMANTTEQMALLKQGVLDLAGNVGEAPTQLSSALYDIVSAGYSGADALEVLGASAKAARAGLTTTKVAADAVTTALNAYGMSASEAERVTDILQTTVKYGKTTWGELAPTIGQVIPLAAAAGVSLEELAASVAVLTANGVQTSMAVTQVRSLIAALLKDTGQAAEVMDEYGFTIDATTLRQKGLIGTLEELQKNLQGDTTALFKFLGRIEAVNAALALTTDQGFKKLLDVTDEMRKATGVVDEAFNKQLSTAQGQIDRFTSSLATLKVELGQGLLPMIGEVAGALANLIDLIRRVSVPNLGAAEKLLTEAGVDVKPGDARELARLMTEADKAKRKLAEVREAEKGVGFAPGDYGAMAKRLEGLAVKAGMSKGEIDEFRQSIIAAFRAGDRIKAKEILDDFGKRIESVYIKQIDDLDKRISRLGQGHNAAASTEVLQRIQKELSNAREQALALGNADIFKSAAAKAVSDLEKLKEQFKDDEAYVAQIDTLIKSIKTEAANIRITPKTGSSGGSAGGGMSALEKRIKALRDQANNIVLRVTTLGGDPDEAIAKLQKMRAELEKIAKTGNITEQNQALSLIKSIDMSLESLSKNDELKYDKFGTWLKKVTAQANLGTRPVEDVLANLYAARAKLMKQVKELGPLDSKEKLEVFFELDAQISNLDGVISQLENKVKKGVKGFNAAIYEEYQDSRMAGLGLELSKDMRDAIKQVEQAFVGGDAEAARRAAEYLRNMLEAEWLQLPEGVKKMAEETLARFNTFNEQLAQSQQQLAEIVAGKRYGDGMAMFASALAQSFDTAGQALMYLVSTGNTGRREVEALTTAFGDQGRVLAEAATGWQNMQKAVAVGAMSEEQFKAAAEEALAVLTTLIGQVKPGTQEFNTLADMILNTKQVLSQFGEESDEATQKLSELREALRDLTIVKSLGVGAGGGLESGLKLLAADSQMSRDELLALTRVFGDVGAAAAQALGGIAHLDNQLSLGIITQDDYVAALEQARDILYKLAMQYQDDPVKLALYARALDEVNRKLADMANAGIEAASKMLPEELQRRAAGLASQYKNLGAALAALMQDGELSERELQILNAAFGDQADTVKDALDGFKKLRTELDLGLISEDEYKRQLEGLLPALEEAFSKVDEGSAAWFALAAAIKAVKNATEDAKKELKDGLSDQIAGDIKLIGAKKAAGLFGSGRDADREELEGIAQALRSRVAKAIEEGMSPDNPEIQAAIQRLNEVEIQLRFIGYVDEVVGSLESAGLEIAKALGHYLVDGGADAGEKLGEALRAAGDSVASTLEKVLAKAGGDIGGDIGKSIGQDLGGAIGGTIGTALGGGIGTVLGTILGSLVGNWIGGLFDWLTGANNPPEPESVPDKAVSTSVSEINYTAVANVYYTEQGGLDDPETRARMRSFIRQTAADLLEQLGLVKGGEVSA